VLCWSASLAQGLLTEEVAFPQLHLVSTALRWGVTFPLIKYSIMAHRSEETYIICQGSLEKEKKDISQMCSLTLAGFPYIRNDSKFGALCQ